MPPGINARDTQGRPLMIMALLLDLANILGGSLVAISLLRRLPRVGDDLGTFAARMAPFAWVVGLVALVTGGYYLLVHLVSGPHLFHYEVVGIGIGIILLWDRLTGRRTPRDDRQVTPTGPRLVLAAFGIVAIAVGLQGLFTPEG